MKITLKIEDKSGCPSKNKELIHDTNSNYITIVSKPYISDHYTMPISLIKDFIGIIEGFRNIDE